MLQLLGKPCRGDVVVRNVIIGKALGNMRLGPCQVISNSMVFKLSSLCGYGQRKTYVLPYLGE